MERTKNSILVLTFPLLLGIAASFVLAVGCTLFGIEFPFLEISIGFLISTSMLKYLEYTKTFHCYLAAVYFVISFFAYLYARTFTSDMMVFTQASLSELFIGSLLEFLFSWDILDVLVLITMPICTYKYFMYRRYI
jgi:hypothetical protein